MGTNQQHFRGFFALADVMDAARGRWARVLSECGVRTEFLTGKHGPCPGCGGKDRFRYDDKGGDGTFLCSQGGGGNLAGNGLSLLQHCLGWDFKRCCEEVGSMLLPDSMRVGYDASRGEARPRGELNDELPAAPVADKVGIPPYNEAMLREYVASVPPVTRADLRRVSPLPVEGSSAADFLEVLYGTNERVLIFTNFYSQGDFLYQVGAGGCRLAAEPGVMAVKSELPTTAKNGIWYLCNPVDGKWQITERKRQIKWLPKDQHGPPEVVEQPPKYGRRTWRSVTRYRYAVLESDDAPEELWLRALWKLPVPIVAVYSSGGKSLHALVRIDASSQPEWDMLVRGSCKGSATRVTSLMSLVCPLGADPNAMTAVRLTRLPFCFRQGSEGKQGYRRYEAPRLQELVYLRCEPLNRSVAWNSMEFRHGG